MKPKSPSELLVERGTECEAIYEVGGDRRYLEEAIVAFDTALKQSQGQRREQDSSIRAHLAHAHYLRGFYFRSLPDYTHAIELQTQALSLLDADRQPHVYGNRAGDLALYLSTRFDRINDMKDLERSVELGQQAIRYSNEGTPHVPKCMAIYANSLVRYAINRKDVEESAVVEDLQKAGRLFEQALGLFTPGDMWKAQACFLYAYCLVLYSRRLEKTGTDFYDRAVALSQQAVEVSKSRIPLQIASLGWLNFICYCRHLQTARADHLDEAILAAEHCRDILPLDHSFWTFNLPNLANYYVDRFEYTGDPADVDSAIKLLTNVLSLITHDEPTRPARLFALGRAYTARFACTARVQDLDEAVQTYRDTVRLSVPSQKATYLQYLGCALVERSIHQQSPPDLDKAIDRLEEAILVAEKSMQSGLCADLANALTMRYKTVRDGETHDRDLSRALELYDLAARDPTLLKHHDRHLSQYGAALQEKWQRSHQPHDLATAIHFHRRALEMAQAGNGRLDLIQVHLASALREMYVATKGTNPEILKEASRHLEAALNFVGQTHPLYSMHLNELARTYVARWKLTGQESDLKLAQDIFRSAALATASVPKDRLEAAMAWVELSQGNTRDALQGYRVAVDLLPRVAWLGLDQDVRYRTLHWVSLGTDAAACAIEVGELELAVELLEQGRSVLWNQSLQLRQEQHELERLDPDLANELADVGRVLELNISRKTGQSGSTPTSGLPTKGPTNEEKEEWDQQNHRKLVAKWETLVEEVRQYRGFENFLRSAPYSTLRTAAANGPIVIINVSTRRCDALIVNMDRPIQLVPLAVKSSVLDYLANTLHESLARAVDRPTVDSADNALRHVMDELWRSIAAPICTTLQRWFPLDGAHRLWLIPTGSLTALPLHAATSILNTQIGLPSLAVISYTTCLTALIRARRLGNQSHQPRLLAVSQPIALGKTRLPDSPLEVQVLYDLLPPTVITHLRAEDATVSNVTVQLERHNFLHLCSHGEHDLIDPYQSSFALYDGPLLLSEIMKLRLIEADFAFLSACHTARVDPRAADECVHLASSLHLAGYKSIIATMWGIIDMDGPEISRHVYEYLTRNGIKSKLMLSHTEAAEALHFAVVQARATGKPAIRWVPFVHHGV